MRYYPFSIILLVTVLLFSSCERKSSSVIISGIILDADVPYITYTDPGNGFCFAGFMDTIPVNAAGEFEIRIENLKESSFSFIKIPELDIYSYFIVEPDDKIYMEFINKENEVVLNIRGNNGKGHERYMQEKNWHMQTIAGKLAKVEISRFPEEITELKKQVLAPYEDLLTQELITPSFYELLSIQMECLYASAEAYSLFARINFQEPDEALVTYLENVLAMYPVNSDRLARATIWLDYVRAYISMYRPLLDKDDIKELTRMQTEGGLHAFFLNKAQNVLSPRQLAFVKSSYIYLTSLQMEYKKEFIEIYEQMIKEYPDNPWQKYPAAYIEDLKKYYSVIEQPFPEGVLFVENYSRINSLKEAIALFKGKKVYVDVWATWCGPCKREFEYKNELKKYLQETDTEMLYISFDQPEQEQAWFEMIKYYGLEGNHILINEAFRADLFEQYDSGGNIGLPWYILFDENGHMIEKHTSRPSEIAETIN